MTPSEREKRLFAVAIRTLTGKPRLQARSRFIDTYGEAPESFEIPPPSQVPSNPLWAQEE